MNLTDVNLEPIVAKAILDTLTPEAREAILQAAVKDLITKPTGGMGSYDRDRKSPLQEAFNSAVRSQAEKFAREQLAADGEFQAQVKGLFAEVAERLFTGDKREALISDLAEKMARAMVGDRY
jgi:hypothetical protein